MQLHPLSHVVPKVHSFAAAAMAHIDSLQPPSDVESGVDHEFANWTATPSNTGECILVALKEASISFMVTYW